MSILTVEEEDEFDVFKEHISLHEQIGYMKAKYPFKRNPSILMNDSNEARSCQINQEKRK